MKTAVSIPDDVYREVEELAKRLNKPRSQVYAEALREYLAHHDSDAITSALNAVYGPGGEDVRDPAIAAAAHRLVQRVEW